jgi:hypothetical protein
MTWREDAYGRLDAFCGLNPQAVGIGREIDGSPLPFWRNRCEDEMSDWRMKDIELAIAELLDAYRNKVPRNEAAKALKEQMTRLVLDDGWDEEKRRDEDVPEPQEANDGATGDRDEDFVEAAARAVLEAAREREAAKKAT